MDNTTFTPKEARSIVRAVNEIATLAVKRIAGKWADEGFRAVSADPRATNPYSPPTHAHQCWEMGANEARRGQS